MSIESDHKTQHARQADQAITRGNYRKAAFHLAKAGEYALRLAEKSDGRIGRNFILEAGDLVTLAEQLSEKALAAKPAESPTRTDVIGTAAASEPSVSTAVAPVSARPDPVRFADLVGMDELVSKINTMVIQKLLRPDLAKKWQVEPGGAVLLYGPPGTGKTTAAKAIANELGARFFAPTGADVHDMFVGQSEKKLKQYMDQAKAARKAVIFFDEVDSLFPKRGGNSVIDDRMVTQFTNEFGGFNSHDGMLLIVGATNEPWRIDAAVMRRFKHKFYVPLPNEAARIALFERRLRGLQVDPALSVARLAAAFDGFSGADITNAVEDAKESCLASESKGVPRQITEADIVGPLRTITKSAGPELIRKFEKYTHSLFGGLPVAGAE